MRHELDAYAEKLHEKQHCGYTLSELINAYESFRDAKDISPFAQDTALSFSPEDLGEHVLILERLVAAARAIGHPCGHPLTEVHRSAYTHNLKTELTEKVTAFKDILPEMSGPVTLLAEALGYKVSDFDTIEKLYKIACELVIWYSLPHEWAQAKNKKEHLDGVKKMAVRFMTTKKLKDAILKKWEEPFLNEDGNALLSEYTEISGKWFIPKFFAMRKFVSRLSVYSKAKINKDAIKSDLIAFCNYQKEKAETEALFEKYGKGLGSFVKGDNTNWNRLIELADKAVKSGARLKKLSDSEHILIRFCADRSLKEPALTLKRGFTELAEKKIACYTLLELEETAADENWFENRIELCTRILENTDCLKEWTAYREIYKQAEEAGLSTVLCSYVSGMDHDDVIPAYNKEILRSLISYTIDESDTMSKFSGTVFSEKVEQFKRIDKELIDLSRKELYCRLASRVPNFVASASHSSELGILQRAIKSGARGVSLRKLFDSIPNLLPRLCPCMLMSPISASQYLDPKREAFDIVVFDEASQLPTCKAVGVMARGRDAIIVGDPKQMPPTSFFATSTSDEEDFEIEDLESILDDCLAINMPETHLLWHYRSRHESLIAFSNSQFYENKLFTFPSVNDRESKVTLVHVDGFFDRGKTRRNKAEAEAIVEELKKRCHDPARAGESVGIVTFNISQQNLIDDLLSEACASDPELEKWAYESEEPLFIKNLENVQGDERDVILFSIGYGPDENGCVYMNFGPLNRDGGWRRLNVAVSRARLEMMVFSTLTPDQINLSRTNSEGVAALKMFLEYASGRDILLSGSASQAEKSAHSGIIQSICEKLREEGFECDVAVGHSEYRVDIGVIDPKNTENYLLGILLDGESYKLAKSTRDREVAQINVLESLNWKLMRVWSMDWWEDHTRVLDRIVSRVKALNEDPNASEEIIPVSDVIPNEIEEAEEELVPVEPTESESPVIPYKKTVLKLHPLTPEQYVSGSNNKIIYQVLQRILRIEGPISHELLSRRVLEIFNIPRSSAKLQSHTDYLIKRLAPPQSAECHGVFYWHKEHNPSEFKSVRIADETEERRDADDIAPEEAVNAICYIISQQISLSEEDLVRETSKLMGFTRTGPNVATLIHHAIEKAVSDKRIKSDVNGNLTLNDCE